jgi:hypothetical protein
MAEKKKPKKMIQDILEAKYPGFDPILEMVAIYKDADTPLDLKIGLLKDIAPYVHAKQKTIDPLAGAKIEFKRVEYSLTDLAEANKRLKMISEGIYE